MNFPSTDTIPIEYCSKCGKQLISIKKLEYDNGYDEVSGKKHYWFECIMRCPSIRLFKLGHTSKDWHYFTRDLQPHWS
ncbi:MAG: hypothetical protein WC516_08015 [Patescibacteria group bacterium]|jgi:hypothetical protein